MHPDILGWSAAALMVATFSCRDARHLRPLAVATNLAFVGYGAAAGLLPVLVLHLLLLPINLWRWAQAVALSRQGMQQAAAQFGRSLCVLVMGALPLVAGCGGGGGNGDTGAPPSTPPSTGTTPPRLPDASLRFPITAAHAEAQDFGPHHDSPPAVALHADGGIVAAARSAPASRSSGPFRRPCPAPTHPHEAPAAQAAPPCHLTSTT